MKNILGPTPALKAGDTVDSWCQACKETTTHVWDPSSKKPLRCVRCMPQAEKENVEK